jgi:hypothetical protein
MKFSVSFTRAIIILHYLYILSCIYYILCTIGATRRNKLLKKATRAQVENVVKQWLRYSCDRDGGRRATNRCVSGTRVPPSYDSVQSDSDVES